MASFRKLPDLELTEAYLHDQLPLESACKHGILSNGMRYFLKSCKKPKNRAALALAVNAGSVLEEDTEQGVAHILEHLAFNATEKYQNHDIIQFLESIGAAFGACSNAYTSFTETVYELEVPTSDVAKALSVFAEFASKIRCSNADLAKERGAVLEEWRGTRDVQGRTAEANWKLSMGGSKYASRMPIGLEEIIRNVPASTVKAFYDRWYRPENMAIVLVGDFNELDAIVKSVETHMGGAQAHRALPAQPVPTFEGPSYSEPRFQTLIDKEQQEATVQASFIQAAPHMQTPADLRSYMAEQLFIDALNTRFFRLSRKTDPAFFGATAYASPLCRSSQAFAVLASVSESGHLAGLEAMLCELARARLHGFSESEVAAARRIQLAEAETTYAEKDQNYSKDWRDEYVRHFLGGEFVIDREHEARLIKALLPTIGPDDLLNVAQRWQPTQSCCIKATSHRKAISVQGLKEVVQKVERLEKEGKISPIEDVVRTDSIIPKGQEPEPGTVASSRDWPNFGATELTLSNGMKVVYKQTDLLDDQILLEGFANGGLTEVPREHFRSCSLATQMAYELGFLGLKPEVLYDVLTGKKAELSLACTAYMHNFSGEQSPVDLELAFQMMHKLFTHAVTPEPEDLATCMKMLRQSLASEIRNPMRAFHARVRFINFGKIYFYEPMTFAELDAIDASKACEYFNSLFCNPASFTVCVTGTIDKDSFLPMVERYLASIPACQEPPVLRSEDVTPLPNTFPNEVVVEEVKTSMVAPQGVALITFPVSLTVEDGLPSHADQCKLTFCSQLLETKLLQLLRFKFGEVYSVVVGLKWTDPPGRALTNRLHGQISVTFTCDPASCQRLVELALSELERLQEEPCSQEEVETLLTLDAQQWEQLQEENSFWHASLVNFYQSRSFRKVGDVDEVMRIRDEARGEVRDILSPQVLLDTFRSFFPLPARSHYTAISLSPRKPLVHQLLDIMPRNPTYAAVGVAGVAALLVGGFVAVRWARRR